MVNDLPLFQWTPPRKVIPFPLHRRRGKVVHVAIKLLERDVDQAQVYWRQTVKALSLQLQKQGVSEAEIKAEIVAFTDAVQKTLNAACYAQGA